MLSAAPSTRARRTPRRTRLFCSASTKRPGSRVRRRTTRARGTRRRPRCKQALLANPSWIACSSRRSPTTSGAAEDRRPRHERPRRPLPAAAPKFTGETVAPGDRRGEDVAVPERRIELRVQRAQEGSDRSRRCTARGGPRGGEAGTRAAPLVKRGEMSQAEFTDHVANLYAHGATSCSGEGHTGAHHGPCCRRSAQSNLVTPTASPGTCATFDPRPADRSTPGFARRR
jgi:hypothetical protein